MLDYVTGQLRPTRGAALTGLITVAVSLFATPPFGVLSERPEGRRPVYLSGAAFSVVFASPFFWLLYTRASGLIRPALVLAIMIAHKPMHGLQATFFSELFGTHLRYSRASIAKSLLAFVGAVLYAITIVSTHTWLR